MRLLWAFLRRDLQVAATYRLSGLFLLLGGLTTLTLFHFLAKTMGEVPLLRTRYGADYFSFALMGVAVATCLRSLQSSFSARLREAQTDGSLEALLCAPHSTVRLISCLAAYPIASALLRSLGLLAAGALLFGAQLSMNPWAFLAVLGASLLAFAPLGLLSAAFVLTFKRAEPFSYFLDMAAYLLSGVLYPTEVLPPFLAVLSKFLPATHALSGLRAAGLQGMGLAAVAPTIGTLLVFALTLWPLAALALALARRHAERTGSLPHA